MAPVKGDGQAPAEGATVDVANGPDAQARADHAVGTIGTTQEEEVGVAIMKRGVGLRVPPTR